MSYHSNVGIAFVLLRMVVCGRSECLAETALNQGTPTQSQPGLRMASTMWVRPTPLAAQKLWGEVDDFASGVCRILRAQSVTLNSSCCNNCQDETFSPDDVKTTGLMLLTEQTAQMIEALGSALPS